MKNFWLILTITSLVWYIFVTIFVSFKGVTDIKKMLKKLSDKQNKTN